MVRPANPSSGGAVVRLIPRDAKYFGLLSGLITKVRSGAGVFVELFGDYDRRAEYAERIKAIEEECDDLAGNIIARLNTTFITPIDREDIYLLTTESDNIIDKINGLARRLDITHAVPLRPDVPQMAAILEEALTEVEAAFGKLEKRTGVAEHGRRIRRLEKQGDLLYGDALRRLFTEESNALEVIKWVSIYEQLEDSIDRCKHLAETLEAVVVKHS
jgi:predicted phosphate transport protein (TIGR00153 family)